MKFGNLIAAAALSLAATAISAQQSFDENVTFKKSVYGSNIYVEHPTYPSRVNIESGYSPKTPLNLLVKGTGDAFYNYLSFGLDSILNKSAWKIRTYVSTPSPEPSPAPLMFESSAYNFRGGELTIAPKVSDGYNPTAKITEAGQFCGVSLNLVHESYSTYRNPRMNIVYNADEKRWEWQVYGATGLETPKGPLYISASQATIDGGNLLVNGTIECKKNLKVAEVDAKSLRANDVKVDLNNAADYVFEENYDLKSLSEVEAYVKANKHLPGVPSASELREEGMSVSEMSNLLLEKVEELTLHLIRVEKENQALKAEIEALKK